MRLKDRQALERALELQTSGNYSDSEVILKRLLELDPSNSDSLHLLGLGYYAQNRNEEALQWLEKAIQARPDEARFLINAGVILLTLGQLDRATGMFREALNCDPFNADAYNNLALVHQRQFMLTDARSFLEKAIALNPQSALYHSNLGNVLRGLGFVDEAIDTYREALTLAPDLAPIHNGLGNALREQNKTEEAVEAFGRAIAFNNSYAEAYFNRALIHAARGETQLADSELETALSIREDPRFRIARAGLLPVIPASRADIANWRERFESAFSLLSEVISPIEGEPTQVAAMNFYLAYHGENNREIMEKLARFYRGTFPYLNWTAKHCIKPRSSSDRKIELGVVSKHFGEHAVALMIYGLLSGLPRDRFNVTAVTFNGADSEISNRIKEATTETIFVPPDIKSAQQTIGDKEFDILLFPDIGMEPISYFLAFARLAPVQCVTWGHPDTTGLETIDYYISNDLAEPANAQEQYTEKLVRLGGVQSWYPRMKKPEKLPKRTTLDLPETGALYLCPQNSIKIHPEMDLALAEILRCDLSGTIVIFDSSDPNWTRLLLERWLPIFGNHMDRVRVLPRCSLQEFIGVIALCDVVLDTWPFGAGNTNYQTFAMSVPVVTLPGRWLRGRGTLAHYQHMGIEECIASTPKEYTAIAVRLGTDEIYRAKIARDIKNQSVAVLEDDVSIQAFASFLEDVAP